MIDSFGSRIVYEDNHLLVVNKLANEIVQGDKTGDSSLVDFVKAYIKEKYNKPGNVFAGLVHRIDRPVGGLVIFTKTGKALARMNRIVQQRELKKEYLAIVRNKPHEPAARLQNFLLKNQQQNKSYVMPNENRGAKKAVLDYEYIASSDSFHLLKIRLHTGRHHQIRVQLAHIGSPILGDLKYGDKRPLVDASIALHAHKIQFIHPVQQIELALQANPPLKHPWSYFTNYF